MSQMSLFIIHLAIVFHERDFLCSCFDASAALTIHLSICPALPLLQGHNGAEMRQFFYLAATDF